MTKTVSVTKVASRQTSPEDAVSFVETALVGTCDLTSVALRIGSRGGDDLYDMSPDMAEAIAAGLIENAAKARAAVGGRH